MCNVLLMLMAPASIIYTAALQHTQRLGWGCMHSAAAQLAYVAAAKHGPAWMVAPTSQTLQILPPCMSLEGAANQQEQTQSSSHLRRPCLHLIAPCWCHVLH